jgi:hypothetical protein
VSPGIQHLDLGKVYDILLRQKSVDLQGQQVAQQGQMNALQMARAQRENDTYDRKQSALSVFNDVNATPEQKQAAMAGAFPEEVAQREFTRQYPTAVTGKDRYLETPEGLYDLYAPGGPKLVGGGAQYGSGSPPSAPPSTSPTLTTGGHGPIPVPPQNPLSVRLASSESGGKPGVVNSQGYSGKYQFGEAAAIDAGFYEADDNPNDNKWNGRFKLDGVTSYQDFLANSEAQDQAYSMHEARLDTEIEGRGLTKYIGQTIGGVPVTRDALIGMMHLGGAAGVQRFLESGGEHNPADSNGTRLSDYGIKFSGTRPGQQPQAQPTAPVRTAAGNKAVIDQFGTELGYQLLGEERRNPDKLLSDVLPPEMIDANPHWQGMTIAQARQSLETRLAGTQPTTEQPQRTQQAPERPQQASAPFSDERYDYHNRNGRLVIKDGKVEARDKRTGQHVMVDPPGSGTTTLTDAEAVAAGFPKGSIVERDARGNTKVIKEGEKPQTNKDIADVERNWRTDFNKPIAQSRDLTSQVGIIRNALATKKGPGDIAGIIAFNKLLDPGAVVREADVALTLQAQGLGDRLETWMANKQEGDVLPQPLRDELLSLSERIYQTSNSYLRDGVMTYREAIEHGGGNFDYVLPPGLRKSLGWDDQPDANKWERVELPANVTPQGQAPLPPGIPALPSPNARLVN